MKAIVNLNEKKTLELEKIKLQIVFSHLVNPTEFYVLDFKNSSLYI
jgi:hypothetical protein